MLVFEPVLSPVSAAPLPWRLPRPAAFSVFSSAFSFSVVVELLPVLLLKSLGLVPVLGEVPGLVPSR